MCDLHERYGIDMGDRALLRARSWPWLATRILGLLDVRSRLTWDWLSHETTKVLTERMMEGANPVPWS